MAALNNYITHFNVVYICIFFSRIPEICSTYDRRGSQKINKHHLLCFQREEMWSVWKNEGCPEFKKTSVNTLHNNSTHQSEEMVTFCFQVIFSFPVMSKNSSLLI